MGKHSHRIIQVIQASSLPGILPYPAFPDFHPLFCAPLTPHSCLYHCPYIGLKFSFMFVFPTRTRSPKMVRDDVTLRPSPRPDTCQELSKCVLSQWRIEETTGIFHAEQKELLIHIFKTFHNMVMGSLFVTVPNTCVFWCDDFCHVFWLSGSFVLNYESLEVRDSVLLIFLSPHNIGHTGFCAIEAQNWFINLNLVKQV